MAAVLEILTIPRAAASMAAPSLHSSTSPVSNRRLQFKSIIHLHPARASVSFASPAKLPRSRARITCEARGASVEVAPVSDDAWQSLVLESDLPVLVEFWAPWCGPCRMIHPVIDELAKEYSGKLKCYKVNTDECPNIATNYGIRSIPTVMVFKNGEKKDAVIGAVPKTTLSTCIEKFL